MEDITVQVHNSSCSQLLNALATYTTKVLKPNISQNTNTLSHLDFDSRNVKYVIKWDYDLLDGTITIPKNCLIEFDGGSIKNGTLIGDNTIIITSQKDEDILKNVNLEGTFKFSGRSADLTLSYQDFNVENNEKVETQYKTVVITDDDGKTISFDVLVPVKRRLNEYTISINTLEGTINDPEYIATGDTYSITKLEDSTIILPTPTKSGYNFLGWNTNQENTGTPYRAGTAIKVTQDLMLYAIWAQIQYTITFSIEGGSGSVPNSISGVPGSQITLPTYSGTKQGYTLVAGWYDGNTLAGDFGESYTITGNKILKIKWNVIQKQYLLSTSIPSTVPTWSESSGAQTILGSLVGWDNWKNQTYQYISFPKKSSEDINDYFEHLDAYESSLAYLYINQNNSLSNVITFRFNIAETMVPLGDSNQNNKVKIK